MKSTNKLIVACLPGCLHLVRVSSKSEINATMAFTQSLAVMLKTPLN